MESLTSSLGGPLEPLEEDPSPARRRSRSAQLADSTAFSSASLEGSMACIKIGQTGAMAVLIAPCAAI